MKYFFSEFQPNYSKYHFPYQVYGLKEKNDNFSDIYSSGLLPSRQKKGLFYLARSLRIDLSKFSPNSENRRILRKTDYLNVQNTSLENLEYHYSIAKMGKDFYDKRFGKGTMSAYKLKWLFTKGTPTNTFIYTDKTKKDLVVGYCASIEDKKMVHYAYPFYRIDYFDKNAGMGMMVKAIKWAKENNKDHVYLGTCYTEDSLYKLQFDGLEYFTGWKWSSDMDELKKLVREGIKEHRIEDSDKNIFSKVF